MKQKNGGWIALFLAPACILFILIFAIPLGMVFVTSLFDYRLLPRTFSFVGFQNFIKPRTTASGPSSATQSNGFLSTASST